MNTYGPMYLFVDTETGGVDCNIHSLLSAAFILTDDTGTVVDKLELFCKPVDEPYTINAEALSINNINLVEHHAIANTYTECGYDLLKFLNKYHISKANTTLVGHRVHFDLGFLKKITDSSFLNSYVKRNIEDTAVIANFLRIPFRNLNSLAEYLKVETSDITLHSALGDAEITRRVYFKMFDMVHGDTNGQETVK